MSSKCDFIVEITTTKETWSIVARVIRLWFVPNYNNPNVVNSMEMVLMDEKGDRIHASVRRALIYKFQNYLKEGLVYSMSALTFSANANVGAFRTTKHQHKLSFQFGTKISSLGDTSISANIYSFVPLVDILHQDFNRDYLVDVMGLITAVGTEREYERNGEMTKMNVIELDIDGFKIECASFGMYVDELNSFLTSGDVNNAVVIVQFAKVKTFQGKTGLQNALNTTKLIFNPGCTQAIEFKKRMCANNDSPTQGLSQLQESSTRVCIEEDFLVLTPRKTIQQLKKLEQECCCIVLGTIEHVVDAEDWWYTAYLCGRSVYPDSKMYYCDKCDKHVLNVIPRYRIKVKVVDDTSSVDTNSAVFVIFDHDASYLTNKSCAEMIETLGKDSASFNVPQEIAGLVDKTFLFKVEFKVESRKFVASRFEKSFTVKKICSDPVVVQKFKDLKPSVAIVAEDESLNTLSNGVVVQDLMPKFSDVVAKDLECGNGVDYDLTKDSDDITPAKRTSEEECYGPEGCESVKHLKKDIKVEKD